MAPRVALASAMKWTALLWAVGWIVAFLGFSDFLPGWGYLMALIASPLREADVSQHAIEYLSLLPAPLLFFVGQQLLR
ncbi:MAG TPA: hypothetical protein VEU47_13830 [Candidatus Cybelea sp.]|nr:hypothetical protein [Candidatus Cybelea sp.]